MEKGGKKAENPVFYLKNCYDCGKSWKNEPLTRDTEGNFDDNSVMKFGSKIFDMKKRVFKKRCVATETRRAEVF